MIEIISSDDFQQNLLKQAINRLNIDVVVKENPDVTSEADLFISIAESDFTEAQKKEILCHADIIPGFILTSDEAVFSNEEAKKFEEVMSLPLRIGHLLKYIQLFYQHKILLKNQQPIELNQFLFKPNENKLSYKKNNQDIQLTEKENFILYFLYQNKGQSVSRETLLEEIWGYSDDIETHTLETHIYRLRQKIEELSKINDVIKTNDEGYYLEL